MPNRKFPPLVIMQQVRSPLAIQVKLHHDKRPEGKTLAAYGAAYVPGTGALLAVGPGGAALSRDDGRTWTLLDDRTFWGVTAAGPGAAWLVGPEGRVVRVAVD